MIRFIAKKIAYGLLVLFGVVSVVFFLFNLSPADPVRNLVGENAPEEVVENMRRKFGLDLPLFQRYTIYLNDLSPLAMYNPSVPESRIFLDEEKISAYRILSFSTNRVLVLKWPYLNRSFISEKSVSSILAESLPGTFVLAVVSISLALVLGLVMGIVAALHKDKVYDRFILAVSAIGMSGPSFFVAILIAWIGAVLWYHRIELPIIPLLGLCLFFILSIPKVQRLGMRGNRPVDTMKLRWVYFIGSVTLWLIGVCFFPNSRICSVIHLPGTGLSMTGSLFSVDVWEGEYLALHNMILPVATLMIRPLAVIVQLMRSSMLEVLSQDYIRTARAKGLSKFNVVYRHALRNALNPVVTAVSGWFASLLAGAVFVEFVFGWKGLGQQMFAAIEKQDLPVVLGGVIVIATAFVVVNILVDLIYGWIDPRVRIG